MANKHDHEKIKMKFNSGYLLKSLPIWVPLTLFSAAFLLVTIIPRYFSSYLTPYNQMAYISNINGDVRLSDGIADVSAQNGALSARSTRVLLKTGNGNANLKMRDGSSVIIDSSSIIEFNREYMKAPGESFAFNLVSGRALLINGQDANIPTQVFVGGNITARVFQAVIGLEVKENDLIHQQVDCLIGPCLVNGILQLVSGQSASIGLDGTVQLTRKIAYESWIVLGKVGAFNFDFSSIFADVHPSMTPTVTATITLTQTPTMAETLVGLSGTPSSVMTSTVTPVNSQTPTLTSTLAATPVYRHPFPTLTPQATNALPPTSTPLPASTPVPTWTPIPTETPFPSDTPYPTPTISPQPSDTPIPTDTLPPVPTSTQVPTDTPVPMPTDTLAPTVAPTQKHTPKPTHTVPPPPTSTPVDTLVPTDVPIPTDTPIPPTDVPAPTPTDTPVANNLSPWQTALSHRKNSGVESLMG